jgi:hypothetical protein
VQLWVCTSGTLAKSANGSPGPPTDLHSVRAVVSANDLRWTTMFLFSLVTSSFCSGRQFVVGADEIFDIFGGLWATVAHWA